MSAALETLRIRATLLAALRQFFDDQGYLEVETPLLSPDVVVDTHLEPFSTVWRSDPRGTEGEELFLQTSPEFAHKRLLAAGSGPIFEVFRAFRNGESGQRHNPEFTLIEWYYPGDDHHAQMDFTEKLVRHLAAAAGVEFPLTFFARMPYDEAFERYIGTRVLERDAGALAEVAIRHNVSIPNGLRPIPADRDEWLNLLLAERVEPHLGIEGPTFLYDYPASQAALARIRDETPPVAERFELYINGIELCNGYHELCDAKELRQRNVTQNEKRRALGLRELPVESRLLAAMEEGLPPCAGVALGFDRLLMLLLGKEAIADVRAFLTESSFRFS